MTANPRSLLLSIGSENFRDRRGEGGEESGGGWEEKEEEARVLGCASTSCRGHGAGGEGDPAVVVASEEKATVGRSHALLVTVRRWKEGRGLAGPARHWGGRWAERPASPGTFLFTFFFFFFL